MTIANSLLPVSRSLIGVRAVSGRRRDVLSSRHERTGAATQSAADSGV